MNYVVSVSNVLVENECEKLVIIGEVDEVKFTCENENSHVR
jgi:hypothetical protein